MGLDEGEAAAFYRAFDEAMGAKALVDSDEAVAPKSEFSEHDMHDIQFTPEIESKNYDIVTDMKNVCDLEGDEFAKSEVGLVDQVD